MMPPAIDCWSCGYPFKIQHVHKKTGYGILACANCNSPAKVFDLLGMRIMDGESYEGARAYAVAWMAACGALDNAEALRA